MNRFLFPFLLVSAIANAAEERVFLLANYHAQGATELYRSLGHIPENSLILEGGLMIWAIFDADSPHANRYMEQALSLRVAKESDLRRAEANCELSSGTQSSQSASRQAAGRGTGPAPGINQPPQCKPELRLLIKQALESPRETSIKA